MTKLCLATGGTGGHIYPALALADLYTAQDPSRSVFFVGNSDRMEAQLIPDQGYPFYGLHSSGLEGSVFHKAKAVLQVFGAYRQALAILKKEKPDAVMGFGGYVSAPVLKAAQHLHIPVLIHEQNSVVGKANQLVMKKADAIITCYERAAEVFGPDRVQLLGNPRATIAAQARGDLEYFKNLGLDPAKKTILIMMGSLGSSSINELMKDALKELDESLQILYVCGKANDQDLNLFSGQPNIFVVPYVDTLKIYPFIDGLIARAGATTIAELTALGLPSILIPSPYVANNHQYYNASQLTARGAAAMIEEKDLNAASLRRKIQDIFLNEGNCRKVAAQARSMGKPNAAYDIMDVIEKTISK